MSAALSDSVTPRNSAELGDSHCHVQNTFTLCSLCNGDHWCHDFFLSNFRVISVYSVYWVNLWLWYHLWFACVDTFMEYFNHFTDWIHLDYSSPENCLAWHEQTVVPLLYCHSSFFLSLFPNHSTHSCSWVSPLINFGVYLFCDTSYSHWLFIQVTKLSWCHIPLCCDSDSTCFKDYHCY